MTTALTIVCPACGAPQGKVCRDGSGAPVVPHSERHGRHEVMTAAGGPAVYLLVHATALLPEATLLESVESRPGYISAGRYGDADGPVWEVPTERVLWVGWKSDFTPDLFDPQEAIDALKG